MSLARRQIGHDRLRRPEVGRQDASVERPGIERITRPGGRLVGRARRRRSGGATGIEISGVLIDCLDRDRLPWRQGVALQRHRVRGLVVGSAERTYGAGRKEQIRYEEQCGSNTKHCKTLSVSQLKIGCQRHLPPRTKTP
jgi:hypothetical protein